MTAFRSLAPYLEPGLVGPLMPVAQRFPGIRRALIRMPQGSRLRRELMLRYFASCYRYFNETGRPPYEIFASDVVLTQTAVLIDTAGSFRGYEGIDRALAELHEAFDSVRFEPELVAELGPERFLLLVRFRASGRESGLDWDRRLGHLFTLKDGSIDHWEVYWEEQDALEAAGLAGQSPGGSA